MGVANAGPVKRTDFIDYSYAQSIWSNWTDRDAIKNYWNQNCKNAYVAEWMDTYKSNPDQAFKLLDTSANKNVIQHCFDLNLTLTAWRNGYTNYRRGDAAPYLNGAAYPWNNPGRGFHCTSMMAINIFTNSCTDWPDWRSKKNRLEDEANVAKNWPVVQEEMAKRAANN